jgi:hypothetical protein
VVAAARLADLATLREVLPLAGAVAVSAAVSPAPGIRSSLGAPASWAAEWLPSLVVD